ncbi:MAG: adenosylmethionine--8-amino-7-oxononanoate transaminase [Gammaproteobacteria bacterium]|nr:adenosylmethionine--8-amino-7-oxononanoate transaminase [Gammaproteobacteria bacterium]MDH5277027.1 adenosylmethionine--8-amino-7-oxononanoate transaminase [Gammaproteobacteria bacterium]
MNSFDRDHLWHPYTSTSAPLPAYEVASASGVRIRLKDGRELIDGMASWWCVIHGYNHPELNRALEEQLHKVAHVMFGGFTHEPAIELGRKLVSLTPEPLQHVFFSDSGSVSVEVAIKMALQYWQGRGRAGKTSLLTLRGGYHGDTFGAMAVCDPVNGMHQLFRGVLPQHLFAPRPKTRFGQPLLAGDLDEFESMLATNRDSLAAVILEPIVQGAGGMWFYSADYLKGVAELCRQHKVLLIADEIATGFGRTGKLFACAHAGVTPDVLCLGKTLTGGYLSLAATLATREVAEGIAVDGGVLMHGPTYMANPLATAVAARSIELLIASPWQQRIAAIETQLRRELAVYAGHPAVADVRVLGAIGVVETREPVDVAAVQKRFVDAGVWIRPFGRLVYLMPPYVISAADLSVLTAAVGLALVAG